MSLLKPYKQQKLLFLEIALLSLMVLSLPSLEAPKNIFLVLFLGVAILRQLKTINLKVWGGWDWMFLAILVSAFLSTLFAGLSPGDEWKGFRVLLTFIGAGWLVSRSAYSTKEIAWIFWIIIFSAIPPLFYGFWEFLIILTKDSLELHSVGHTNHTAIYLTMIFGAALGASLSFWRSSSNLQKIILFVLPVIFYLSLIVTSSRAAFAVGTLISGILIYLLSSNKKEMLQSALIILMLFSGTIFLNAPILQKQISNQNNRDVLAGRGVIWNTTIEAAKLHPILGIGIDNRANVTKDIIKKSIEARHGEFNEDNYNFHYKHSHSFYLTNIAERGLVGSLVTLVFIFMWFWYLIKTFYITRLSNEGAYLWAGSLSAWCATFVIGFVNTTFHHEHGILACLFLGLHLAFLNKKGLKLKKSF